VPTAVFCEPAIGAVGLTEAQAIEEAGKPERIRTVVKRFVSLENRFGGNGMQSVFKLVLNARTGRVLGVHLMDNAAPEIVQAMAVALRLGVRESHLETTLQLHPTVAEELFG
jgi:glutathione reductase (NADPH)